MLYLNSNKLALARSRKLVAVDPQYENWALIYVIFIWRIFLPEKMKKKSVLFMYLSASSVVMNGTMASADSLRWLKAYLNF